MVRQAQKHQQHKKSQWVERSILFCDFVERKVVTKCANEGSIPSTTFGEIREIKRKEKNMGKMSRDKGKAGEREWAGICRDHGYPARRTSQYCGQTGDASDVVGLPFLHVEVKRCETEKLHEWIDQAVRDSKGKDLIPIVAHRRSRQKWHVTMLAHQAQRMWEEAGIEDLPMTFDIHIRGEGVFPTIVTIDAETWFYMYSEWEAWRTNQTK